jgi:lysophospholipase L1-like esterase
MATRNDFRSLEPLRRRISRAIADAFARVLMAAFVVAIPLVDRAADGDFDTPDRDRLKHASEAGEARAGAVNVLLIGDSIMGGYFKGVQKELAREANVVRHPGNAGDTRNGLKQLDAWLGDTRWDVIHFNWGLHDLCHRHPESKETGHRDKVRGAVSVPLDEYEKNLETLVQRLEKTNARLIFATTTKVPEGEAGRHVGDEARYNEAALRVMKRHAIPVDDLHVVTAGFTPEMFSKPADVHFSGAGNSALAKEVAAAIRRHGLETPK